MHIDPVAIGRIVDAWRQAATDLSASSASMLDDGLTWPPRVRAAISDYVAARRADLHRLAGDADAIYRTTRLATLRYREADGTTHIATSPLLDDPRSSP
ncbi:hypothetical protein AAFP35_15190 [Gordonia sp. CPCC 206044]|uniref:hypothetical protein n=1 Tax=Gordonia sp. CPCC 206044 TaxID=3140793 RepID=UPI003AF3CC87